MRSRTGLLVAALVAATGCGSGEKAGVGEEASDWAVPRAEAEGATSGGAEPAPAPEPAQPDAPPGDREGDEAQLAFAGPFDRVDGFLDGQAAPDRPGGGQGPGGQGPGGQGNQAPAKEPPQAGPLLIYQATVHLAVHEVAARQRAVVELAREVGGFLAAQDGQRVVIRVPSRRFAEALEKVERVGDLLHKTVQAEDVSEQYRDLSLRLRNAEVVRDRLEQLLQKADKVEDALKVAKELSDVTERIELLKGRLRWLQDRIALSTITVLFQPKATQSVEPQGPRLPFGWLDELGLPTLFNLYQ